MPSPIRQAELQAELLGKLLNDHKETLRRKVFLRLRQGYLGDERFRVLVAISDTGVIVRQHCDPPELCKAATAAGDSTLSASSDFELTVASKV